MQLHYATEETPLGTAGSVRNAQSALRDDAFLVISGDEERGHPSLGGQGEHDVRQSSCHRRPMLPLSS